MKSNAPLKNNEGFSCVLLVKLCLLPYVVILLSSCQKQERIIADHGKPQRQTTDYFDKKLLLEKLPDNFYLTNKPKASFDNTQVKNTFSNHELQVEFLPLGYKPEYNLKYTQPYNSRCAHQTRDSIWELTYVGFPDRCTTQDSAYGVVHVQNVSKQSQHYFFRLFWQNTSYWYATDSNMSATDKNNLQNYYNGSVAVEVTIPAGADTIIHIPYTIGRVRKHQYMWYGCKDRATPGNYEFMLLWDKTKTHLLNEVSDFYVTNPFAEVQKKYRTNRSYPMAYVPSTHFKFVFLEEFFDGANDLNPDHYHYVKRHDEKKLCDTCSGWFRNIISERWSAEDFFNGFISKAGYVKADFGNRLENTTIDKNGITMKVSASKRGSYKKTWGEFLFVPSFKYGHVTIRAKFSQMYNYTGTPNGIVHNLWLYQRDRDQIDSTNPYKFVDHLGEQPFEIDFEIWSSQPNINSEWDNQAFINYSIVDYMRNANALIKPGEEKTFGKYKANRFNNRQINIPSEPLSSNFFDSFHTYELFWHPDRVEFWLDGKEVGLITKDMAAIPDKYMFLWIGSPIYQDGTYYNQSNIPFLRTDQVSIVDYIKIE